MHIVSTLPFVGGSVLYMEDMVDRYEQELGRLRDLPADMVC